MTTGPKSEREIRKSVSRSFIPTLEFERAAGYPAVRVAGVDEVGRGCLAGSVYAAALVLPDEVNEERDPWIREIRDSKLLSIEEREALAPKIRTWARAWAVAQVEPLEIDRINIYHASHRAMRLALEKLGVLAGHALIDGNRIPVGLAMPATAVVKGDLKCLSIAAASILAKVERDQEMVRMDGEFPRYGFAVHKGYPTPFHLEALRAHGPCAIHRRSFGPVAACLSPSLI